MTVKNVLVRLQGLRPGARAPTCYDTGCSPLAKQILKALTWLPQCLELIVMSLAFVQKITVTQCVFFRKKKSSQRQGCSYSCLLLQLCRVRF